MHSRGCSSRALDLIQDREYPLSNPRPINSDLAESIEACCDAIVCHSPICPAGGLAGCNDADKRHHDVYVVGAVHDDLRASDGIKREGNFDLGPCAAGGTIQVERTTILSAVAHVVGDTLTKAA